MGAALVGPTPNKARVGIGKACELRLIEAMLGQ
jgi:hypothetical protein